MSQLSILDALNDPMLFKPHFKGTSWTAWSAFLAALFALPMSEAELELYRVHTGRTAPPTAPFKEAALVIGRRGGKSRVLALVAVYLATFRDYEPFLAPGEVATVAILAADRKQARSIFRFVTGLLKATPLLSEMMQDEGADIIRLSNRVVIEIATASFRVTRGYSFAAVLADETAFWRDENSANPAEEIFRALRPGMSSIPGSILLNASSPYRREGVLFNAFRRHFGVEGSRVLVWKASTAAMNSTIDPAIIEEAYADDPESASAEFGGEFRNDLADFVAAEVVESCTMKGRFELPPMPSVSYVAFVDPSGGSADSMTLGIAHRQGEYSVLDAIREIRPPFSPASVVVEFAALLKLYRLREVVGDRFAGEWVREPFRLQGIDYKLSEKTKIEIYRDCLPALNSQKVELLDIPRLASQLCGLERRTARGGRDSIDHPPGGHDDIANSACGALLLAGGGRGPDYYRRRFEVLAS